MTVVSAINVHVEILLPCTRALACAQIYISLHESALPRLTVHSSTSVHGVSFTIAAAVRGSRGFGYWAKTTPRRELTLVNEIDSSEIKDVISRMLVNVTNISINGGPRSGEISRNTGKISVWGPG